MDYDADNLLDDAPQGQEIHSSVLRLDLADDPEDVEELTRDRQEERERWS